MKRLKWIALNKSTILSEEFTVKSWERNLTIILAFTLWVLLCHGASAQDTFSIVAVDTVTGEIGSAGASCVGPIGGVGAFILSDVIEAVGGIHTQASYLSQNQQNAHARMLEGLSPQEIINWLVANDAQGNPTIRQYGIVDLTRNGESAAYTGVNCTDYKNHVTGLGYSIQGNILLGQVIIDTMHTVYLAASGEPLADRLMKTLEAAKIIGADTRCASRGTSSQSGFVKVVRIGDGNNPYLQLVVPDTPVGTDPIDVLRGQFDTWKASLFNVVDPFLSEVSVDQDTVPADGSSQAVITIIPKNNSDTLLASGLEIILSNTGTGMLGNVVDLGDGTYQATITAPTTAGTDTIAATVISGGDTVNLSARPVIYYTASTSIGEAPLSPDQFLLYQNYPEPFNQSTVISFIVPELSLVKLVVYDVLGKEVATLVDGELTPGTHKVEWTAENASSGTYFFKIKAGDFSQVRRMTLMK
jgi:uncharacterized Ntn-hydrolase superfamily protein